MRFPLAALFFIVASFIFFICFAVSFFLMDAVSTGVSSIDSGLPAEYQAIKTLLPSAFGIIGCIFFVSGLLLIFILDSLSDEPEMYWR